MNLENYTIEEHYTVIETMRKLDESAKGVLYVVKNNVLLASVTDGDIRRWLLKKGDLNSEISCVANYNPKFIFKNDQLSAKNALKKYEINSIPIVDENKKLYSIIFSDSEVKARKEMAVPIVIMAGGLGTRLYPYTKILPKPLIPIGDKTILERILDRFKEYGMNEYKVIVNYKSSMIKAYFNELSDYKLTYIDETEPLGTGGGLSLLKGQIDKPFFLTNCDILVDADYDELYEFHVEQQNYITMVTSIKTVSIPYGVIDFNDVGTIVKMKEKPSLNVFVNTGLYVVNPHVIEELQNEFIDFPTIIEVAQSNGKKVGVFPISESKWMDMGEFDSLDSMNKRLALSNE